MTTTHTVKTLASEMSQAFVGDVRTNGDQFRKLRDGSPEWMVNVCHAGHGEMMPDDQRYRFIEACVDALAENDDEDEARGMLEPDVYTSDLTAWLHSRNDRVYYLGEALEESEGCKDGFKLLAIAQGREIEETFGLVLAALQAELDSREENEADVS